MELSEPARYQQTLLEAIAGEDPADVLAGAADEWAAHVAEAAADLRTRPEPSEWSVVELLGHVTDAHLVASARLRWVLAEDSPTLLGYDQDRWVAAQRHAEADPAILLRVYGALAASDAGLWRRSDAAARARTGLHSERGPESFELLFRMIAGHHRVHLAQARGALEAVRRGR